MFIYWACLGFYMTVPLFLHSLFMDRESPRSPVRFDTVRALAVVVAIAGCVTGFATWRHSQHHPEAMLCLAVDAIIITLTIAVAMLRRLSVVGTLFMSWVLSATIFLIAVFLSDD